VETDRPVLRNSPWTFDKRRPLGTTDMHSRVCENVRARGDVPVLT
jgi:hypothetical protein